MMNREWAVQIVDKVLQNITDRRGLCQAWHEIDSDIQNEIRQDLTEIVVAILDKKPKRSKRSALT